MLNSFLSPNLIDQSMISEHNVNAFGSFAYVELSVII